MPTPEQVERDPSSAPIEQSEDVRERAVESGMVPRPTAPQQVNDYGQVIAQPVGDEDELAETARVMQIAIDKATAEAYSQNKNIFNSSYWLGIETLRRVKQALLQGMQIVIKKKSK